MVLEYNPIKLGNRSIKVRNWKVKDRELYKNKLKNISSTEDELKARDECFVTNILEKTEGTIDVSNGLEENTTETRIIVNKNMVDNYKSTFKSLVSSIDNVRNVDSIIDFLTHFPGNSCDQHQIENEFGIKRSTTTVLLQRMAKKNLIERYPSPEDRRQKIVTLTAEGQKLSSDVSAYITQYEEKLKADFSEQDISKIKRFLSTMIEEK